MEKLINRRFSPSQKLSVMLLIILFLQFILGIYTNLYIPVSTKVGGIAFNMGYMMGSIGNYGPIFMLHMMLGPILVIFSLITFILAIVSKTKAEIIFSSLGLISIDIAGFAGMTFFMGGANNIYSFIMALGFIVAFSAYFSNLIRS